MCRLTPRGSRNHPRRSPIRPRPRAEAGGRRRQIACRGGWVYIANQLAGIAKHPVSGPRRRGFTVKNRLFTSISLAVGSLLIAGTAWAHHGDAGRYNEDIVKMTG